MKAIWIHQKFKNHIVSKVEDMVFDIEIWFQAEGRDVVTSSTEWDFWSYL